MSRGLKIITVIVIILTLMAIASVTYAYFVYRSDETALSFEVEGCKVYGRFENGTNISSSFGPAMSKDDEENVISKEIELTPGCENVVINMNINITSIDDALKEESFVYEFYSGDTLITSGNFASATSGAVINLLSGVTLIQNETKEYKLYIYIDGTVDNPSTMAGKTLDASLSVSGTSSYFMYDGLPEQYVEVEYLESSGHQKLDTFIYANSNIKFQIKFYMISGVNGATFIGEYIGTESHSFRLFDYANKIYLDYGSGNGYNRISGSSMLVNTLYEWELGNRYVKDLTTNINLISSSSVSSFYYNDLKILLTPNCAKIYYFKLFESEELVRNFVPAIRISDSKPGMYDTVTQTFFTNQGTGEFGYETLDGVYVAPV